MAHATLTPRAGTSSDLASLPGWSRQHYHCPSPRPGPADGPISARPLPEWRSGRSGPVLPPVRGGDAQARRCAGPGRAGTATPTSHLGGRLDPRDVEPPTPRGFLADDPDTPALVPARPVV